MRVLLLALLLLCPQQAPHRAAVEQREVFLQPDFSTLTINYYRAAHDPCTAWPVREGEPAAYYMRGLILDADGFQVGRYNASGVLRNTEGANVTSYELYIKGVPKIYYGLDAEPLVFGYHIDGLFRDLTPYQLDLDPLIEPGCVWGLRWRLVITIGE